MSEGGPHPTLDERINLRGELCALRAIIAEREKQLDERFSQQETTAEFKRVALQDKVTEAKVTTAAAMIEAKASVEARLLEAKAAADQVANILQTRIEKLESGGAPFASRLDEGMTKLQTDVDALNTNSVRMAVVEGLRARQEEDVRQQKRQIRYVTATAVASFITSLFMVALAALR